MFEKSIEDFKTKLNEAGVTKGSILYISSDIKVMTSNWAKIYKITTKKERNNALNLFVDTFQKVVGNEGTLLFPVFSRDWCRGNGFNIKSTKGEVGALSNRVLENRKDFVRTKHPVYSFMVWGKDAQYLKNMDNQDAWSSSSPFHYLYSNNEKQLLFNIEAFQGLTFGHYMEQRIKVPFRHPKYFFGEYTDEYGNTEIRTYSMYVRDKDVEVNPIVRNDWLVENNVAKRVQWENISLTVADIRKSCSVLPDDLVNNGGKNTLHFIKGKPDMNGKQKVPFEIKGPEI